MTEDLITDLSKLSGLFVIARNSVFTYKDKAVKIAKIAEELGVRYVLEGSVRRAGDQVRINAQLIDATTGGHLWAERKKPSKAFSKRCGSTRSIPPIIWCTWGRPSFQWVDMLRQPQRSNEQKPGMRVTIGPTFTW